MYEDLLGRVVSLETELGLLKAQQTGGVDAGVLIGRIEKCEQELHKVKEECYRAMVAGPDVIIGAPVFRVRNSVEQPMPVAETPSPVDREVRRRPNREFQVGKTVMSVLASLLILCSIVLFGALVYPFLSDAAKVVIMYVISVAFVVVGLKGRSSQYKTFFTALAGCGAGAFYVSSVISYFVFNVFGLGFLFILTYLWGIGVAWLAKSKVPVFAYICYVGILISTALCAVEFWESPVAVGCYLLGMVTLYLFCRSGDYKKDAFWFLQFPAVAFLMMVYYTDHQDIVMWLMLFVTVIYVVQHYLYAEKTDWYVCSLVLTLAAVWSGYWMSEIMDYAATPFKFLNVFVVFLSGLVSIWSYMTFDRFWLKVAPMCVMAAFVPAMNWGSSYEEFISFAPFAMLILLLGYLTSVDLIKGIGCGYMLVYMLDKPLMCPASIFYMILFVFVFETGILFGLRAYESHVDRVAFLAVSGVAFTTICAGQFNVIWAIVFTMAVALSWFFNSDYFAIDDFSERLGWAWIGYWIVFGMGAVAMSESVVQSVFLFLMLLIAMLINGKWQLECPFTFAGFELCAKFTIYLWLMLEKLGATGVVMSILFVLLAIGCIVLGAYAQRKIIRLYGLILSIVSVVKCLLFDVQYSSGIYIPVGLFVAGILCFGISWLYSNLERKLNDGEHDES